MNFGTKTPVGGGLIALGDSYTAGQGASDAAHGYAQRLCAQYIGGTFLNGGVGGTGTSTATNWLLANPAALKARRGALSIMAGFNDVRRTGVNSYAKIASNHRAAFAAAFGGQSVAASAMVRSGNWNNLPNVLGGRSFALGGNALYTNDPAAFLQWSFFGETLVIGAYGVTNNYRNVGVSVDGGAVTPLTCINVMDANSDTIFCYTALVLKNLGFGSHTVKLTPIDTSYWTTIDYVGTLSEPGSRGPLFVGQIPAMTNWTYNGNTINQTILDGANNAIGGVIAEFSEYPITSVPVNSFYSPANSDVTGHPTDFGHFQIMTAFQSRISLWD